MASSMMTGGGAGFSLLRGLVGQVQPRLLSYVGHLQRSPLQVSPLQISPLQISPLQMSSIHTSSTLDSSKNWERKNRIVYPPQLPDEPRRAAEVHHCRRQIKYSKDKMWYLSKMIKGMSIDEAIAQLQFNDKKGAKIMKEVLQEAQEMAVKSHNVEYKSNLYVADAFVGKGRYLKRIRYHGRGRFGIMDKVHCHFFVKLMEGVPPKVEEKTGFDLAKDYVQELKNRTIIHSL